MDTKIIGTSPKRLDVTMKVQGTRKHPQYFAAAEAHSGIVR